MGEEAMRLLGFTCKIWRWDCKTCWQWQWNIKREGEGAADFNVVLQQWKKVEHYTPDGFTWVVSDKLEKKKSTAKAPNLRACTVVSCPLCDEKEEPVHEKLNK